MTWYISIPDPLVRDITFDGYGTPKGGWFVWNDRFYLYVCESNELREFSYTLSGDTLSLSFLQTVDYNARLHAAEGNPQFENVFLLLTATVEGNGESIEAVLTEMPELDAFLTSIDENGIDAARYMGQWQAKGCAANECTADVLLTLLPEGDAAASIYYQYKDKRKKRNDRTGWDALDGDGRGKMEYPSGDALYEAQLAWYPTESGVRIVVINDCEGIILRSMGEIMSFESIFLTADQMEIYLHQISNYWQSDMHLNNDVVISAYEQDENGNAVITSCYAETKRLTIPEEIDGLKIAGIGDGVFSGNMLIEQVVLPEGLQWIGNNAFQNCEKLERIEFPSTLNRIGESAFQNCTQLGSISFAHSVEIGSSAFSNCTQLVQAIFVCDDSGVSTIGSNVFVLDSAALGSL